MAVMRRGEWERLTWLMFRPTSFQCPVFDASTLTVRRAAPLVQGIIVDGSHRRRPDWVV